MIYPELVEPRSANNYSIEVGFTGLITALVEKINIPDVEIITKTHQPPATNYGT